MAKQVIAIKHEIEDESTGAVANYHVIEYVSIDYKYNTVTATMNGYVSKKSIRSRPQSAVFPFRYREQPARWCGSIPRLAVRQSC